MSITKNGDLPAMPLEREAELASSFNAADTYGLTKREQFAMAAMQGLLTNRSGILQPRNAHDVAFLAVELAEALLEQLEKRE